MPRGEGYLRKRGSVWYFEFSYQGRRYYHRIGLVPKTVAKEIASQIRTEIIRGTYIPPDLTSRPFSDLIRAYRDFYLANSQAGEHAKREHLRKIDLIERFFSGKTVREVNTSLIEQFKKELRDNTSMSEVSINKVLAVLRSVFRKAKDLGLYSGDVPKINFYRAREKEIVRYLTQEEVQRLFSVSPVYLRRIILFALNTGCRAGEIISLRWEQVHEDVIVFESKNTKSKRQYTISINQTVKELLNEIRQEQESRGISHGYVFTNSHGLPFSRQGYKRAFKTALKRAGIENFRFHDLRHTFASYVAMLSKDIFLVQKLLNHQSVQTTKRYAHLTQDYVRENLEKISAIFRQEKDNGSSDT